MIQRKSLFYFLPFLFLYFNYSAKSQCPTAAFSILGPACSGQPVMLSNTSANAVNYNWDFCAGDLETAPVPFQNTTTTIPGPRSLETYFDGTNWYAFTVNRDNYSIGRFDFGPSLNNTPTYTEIPNPGSFLSGVVSNNISILEEGGNYYGVLAFFQSNYIILYDFGSSITNVTPTASTIAYPYAFNGCQFQEMINDNGNLILFVGNALNPVLTRYNFGNSITNTPTIDTIQISGVTEMNSIKIVKQCDQWYGFGVSLTSSSATRLDFGSNLLSVPAIVNYGNIGSALGNPISLDMVQDKGKWYLYVQNYQINTIKFDMGNSVINNPANFGISLGSSIGGNYITIAKDQSDHHLFVVDINSGTYTRLYYSNSCTASTAVFTGANPGSVTYSGFGNYFITLTATDANGNTSTFLDSITIRDNPIIDFSAIGNCENSATQFSDLSTVSVGQLSSWNWDFGNGDTSSQQNPSYQYPLTGTYTIQLTATSSYGCSSSTQLPFSISPKPLASYLNVTGCSETVLNFTDQSTIASGSIVNWLWSFPNGDSSLFQNPSYLFPNGGMFNILLMVTSDSGCSDSFNRQILVQDRPIAAFDVTNTCLGQTVQFNNLTTVNGSTISSYFWDLGDGNTTIIANPIHNYPNVVNTYPVQLIANALNGCSDTITTNVRINNIPTVSFSFDPLICQNADAHFIDQSTVLNDTISQWQWDFGDGATSSDKNPIHRYLTAGSFQVTLVSYSPSSCVGTANQQTITVLPAPQPQFTTNVACLGSPTVFTNSTIIPGGQTFNSTWYFTSSDSIVIPGSTSTSYLYPFAGYVNTTLMVVASTGCTQSITLPVKISAPPVAAYSFINNCSGQQVQFSNASTTDTASTLSSYLWDFGDPFSGVLNTSNIQNPSHQFNSAQNFIISLITTNNYGCSDTALQTILIYNSPLAHFTYSPTCFGSQMIFSNPGSAADSAYFWNFGDSQINFLSEPAHYYALTGNYNVTLIVYGMHGCNASASRIVTVSPIPSANFSTPPACVLANYLLTDSSTISSGSIIKRYWYVNSILIDSSSGNSTYVFPDTGNYTVRLTVKSDIGCTNSRQTNLFVHPLPVANFSFTPQFGNPPLDVMFTNLATGGNTYNWNFGDGSAQAMVSQPQHTYIDTGLFAIQQIVTSIYGCKDTAVKNIYIIKPVLDIALVGDSSYYDGNYFHIVATIANLGTREINKAKMEARLDNGSIIKEDFSGLLSNGANSQQTYYFRSSFLLPSEKSYNYYCIRVTNPNDETDNVPTNNEQCFNRTKESIGIAVYPDPFVTNCTIRIIVPFTQSLTIILYDESGKEIATFYDGIATSGLHEFTPDLASLNNGVYNLMIRFNDEKNFRQLVKINPLK